MPYKDKEKQREAQKQWVSKNRPSVSKYQRERRNKHKIFLTEYKQQNNVCTDCKIAYPPHLLDFDHLGDKSFGLGGTTGCSHTMEDILKEIAKCEIVCSNCHRDRTYTRATNGIIV